MIHRLDQSGCRCVACGGLAAEPRKGLCTACYLRAPAESPPPASVSDLVWMPTHGPRWTVLSPASPHPS